MNERRGLVGNLRSGRTPIRPTGALLHRRRRLLACAPRTGEPIIIKIQQSSRSMLDLIAARRRERCLARRAVGRDRHLQRITRLSRSSVAVEHLTVHSEPSQYSLIHDPQEVAREHHDLCGLVGIPQCYLAMALRVLHRADRARE